MTERKLAFFSSCVLLLKITHCAGSEELHVSHFTDEDTEGQRVQCLVHIESLLEAESRLPLFESKKQNILFYKVSKPLAKQNKNNKQ